ncbi:MAG TPA: large conductance mechanosensitive channel protein MscL [Chloroflexota bacterium]
MSGFRKFVLRGNVIDLAVAVVIGAAFGSVVTALVKGIITPLIGIVGGIPDFAAWVVTISGSRFLVGEFVNALIAFLIIALVVYYLVILPVMRLMDRSKDEPPVTTRECPECLSKIPEAARRCAFCTAELHPAEVAELADRLSRTPPRA